MSMFDELEELLGLNTEIPSNAFAVWQVVEEAREHGKIISESTARRRLRKLVEDGKLEGAYASFRDSVGKSRMMWVFWPKSD